MFPSKSDLQEMNKSITDRLDTLISQNNVIITLMTAVEARNAKDPDAYDKLINAASEDVKLILTMFQKLK